MCNLSSDPTENEKKLNPDQVRDAFSSAEEKASELQKTLIQSAQNAGFVRDVFKVTAPFFISLAQNSEDSEQVQDFVYSGVQFANSVKTELTENLNMASGVSVQVSSISASAVSFVSTAGTASLSLNYKQLPAIEIPPYFLPDESSVERKLASFDITLADTYREVGQVYYGTNADPRHAASYMMRQAFDHFFDKFAPDDLVRSSLYWKSKKGENPDQIYRRERMTYAAYTHIPSKSRADTIIANFDIVLKTYEILNKLHTRGPLSEKLTRSALNMMKQFIEAFVDAIEE